MKANPDHPEHEDSRLKTTLSVWQVNESLPPRFQERVWQRIEAAEASTDSTTNWFAALFLRPAFATVIACLFLMAGLTIGLLRANHDSARWDRELGHRYVASVDPYLGQR